MHPASHRGQRGWGCGWPGDAQRPEQEVFLPLPWHCWAADPIPRCGAKTVKAKAQEESEQLEPAELEGGWPWQGEGAGSGSSLAMSGTWLRSRLPCPDAARVCRPSCHPGPPCSCAYRGCGHQGAKSSSAPTCHHPGMNLAELLLLFLGAEELCLSNPAQGSAVANHEAEECNQLPLKYRGDVGKSTEKPGLEKNISGFSWIQPLSQLQWVLAATAPRVQALVPHQWLCPGLKVRGAGKRQRLGGDMDPVQAGDTEGCFWGSPPTLCGCPGRSGSVGRGALPGT